MTVLFLLFQIGSDRYALPANQVREVLPLVELKAIPKSPSGVAGVFNYRGTPVPVLDLNGFAGGTPARASLSTRIILTNYFGNILGILAEHATEMIRREDRDFVEPGLTAEGTPWLGRVAKEGGALIQRVEIESLLPDDVRAGLFKQVGENA